MTRALALGVLLAWAHVASAIGLNFSSPTQTSYIHSASFTVSASAEATEDYERINSVKVYRDGALLASGMTSASASLSNLGPGTYYISATATNSWGESVSEMRVVTVEPSKVIGHIEGIYDVSGTPNVMGWACSTGLPQSIDVHMYVGAGWPSGTMTDARSASLSSEPAVATACKSTGTAYRFSMPLSESMREQHAGKGIYIHGISPVGQSNDLIANSGSFSVPAPPVKKIATFITQSVPTTMVVGQSYGVQVQMRNDGNVVWRASEGYRLGSQGPANNTTWGLHRVELPADIGPGGTATFNFTVRAPSNAGNYAFQWQMLHEGVEWIPSAGTSQSIRVVSGAVSASPNPCTMLTGAGTCASTVTWSSTATDAQVWVTDTSNANPQMFASGQNGSQTAPWIGTSTARFHLKAAGQTIATVDVRGREVSGSISASPNPCTITYGTDTCTSTIAWTSNAPDSEVWVTDAANGNPHLFARAQSGSQAAPWIGTATGRFHLKAGGVTMATVDVSGTPAANQAPTITLTSPADGASSYEPASFTVSATAADSDDGLRSVKVYANGALIHTATTSPVSFTWNPAGLGTYELFAVAEDTRGAQTATPTIRVSVVNRVPTIQLTAPSPGANGIAPATVTLSANASDGDDGIASVSFYANGTELFRDTVAPYAFSWTGVQAGSYNIHAVARDTRGATATSETVGISVVAPVVNPSSSTRHYIYDRHQQLCKVVEPETRATVMGYDAAGNLAWSASGLELMGTAAGQCDESASGITARVVRRTYDARNRLDTLVFPDRNGNQTWRYTKTGQPESIATFNEGGAETVYNSYSYNLRGLLTGEGQDQTGASWGVGYDYDRNGGRATIVYPAGLTLDLAPNALGQPTQVASSTRTYASGIRYYPNGAIRRFTYGNGVVHTMEQNGRQLPERVASTGSTAVLDYTYAYDSNGNVAAVFDVARGPNFDRDMEYDELDRLTATRSPSFGGDHWYRYTYDRLDNITSAKLAGVKDLAEYYYDPGTHRLMSIRNSRGATVMGLDYDPQGNVTNRNGQGYVFDFGNRLRTAVNKESYRYDGHGRRVLSTATTGKIFSMYTQDGLLLWERDERSNKRTQHIYLNGTQIAQRLRPVGSDTETIRYQHTDALGSPVAVTDAAGAVVERTAWEPYGAAIGKPNYQGVGFTGHVMDGVTALTYMQQRYYDPAIGRFLSVDPVTAYENPMGAFNRYWYANNNPYLFTDPDGRAPAWMQGFLPYRTPDSMRDPKIVAADRIRGEDGKLIMKGLATTAAIGATGGLAAETRAVATVGSTLQRAGVVAEAKLAEAGVAAQGVINTATAKATEIGTAMIAKVTDVATQVLTSPAAVSLGANIDKVDDALTGAYLSGPPPMSPIGVAAGLESAIKEEIHRK